MQNAENDKSKDTVRLDLTAEQRAQIKARTGKEVEALKLGVEEMEQRIAPFYGRL